MCYYILLIQLLSPVIYYSVIAAHPNPITLAALIHKEFKFKLKAIIFPLKYARAAAAYAGAAHFCHTV